MLEVNQLIAPISEDSPCGPDLERDPIDSAEPDLMALQAALFTLDASYSEARRSDGDDSAWSTVLNQSIEVLEANKHLRAAVYLCEAAMRRLGLRGLSQALAVVRGLCESYWDHLHPALAAPGGKQSRVNLLGGLGGNSFLAALRNMPLIERVGDASLKACESQAGGADEELAAREFARRVLAPHPKEQLDEALQLAEQAVEHVRWISARVDREFTPEAEVDCGEFLTGVDGKLLPGLDAIHRILGHAVGSPVAHPPGGDDDDAGGTLLPAQDSDGMSKARIREMIDQIIDHYQENEPSSPVPLLLRRAKRLMDQDFIALINDTVGDDAVRKAQQILGVEKED